MKNEANRHKKKMAAREKILKNIKAEQAQKAELVKLRELDADYNLERERKKKQEFQDYWLKKEFFKNAFN